jgi:hypothetical protein
VEHERADPGVGIVVGLSVLVAIGVTYGPAKGLYHRTFRRPAILSAYFIQPFDPHRGEVQRETLFRIWKSGHGELGLRQQVGSVEGTPIEMHLIVQEGKITLIRDYTRDSFGIREFVTSRPVNLILGPLSGGEVHPLDDRFPSSGVTSLKCVFTSGRVVFF